MKLKILQHTPMPGEDFEDPLSPNFRKGFRMAGGTEPLSRGQLGIQLFRFDRPFGYARAELISGFEQARKLHDSSEPDSFVRSIRMMGPIFTKFVDFVAQLPDFEMDYIAPEVALMADFYRLNTAVDPETALLTVQGHIYELLAGKPEGRSEAEHVRLSGVAFGRTMSDHAEALLEQRQVEREFMKEKQREEREARRIHIQRMRPIWEEKRAVRKFLKGLK